MDVDGHSDFSDRDCGGAAGGAAYLLPEQRTIADACAGDTGRAGGDLYSVHLLPAAHSLLL